ncbi:MAG TPA: low molecular weight protein arginine phosphatase [Elusimicrobiota bacterium]|jgi:protein-tyrosine-phosphatase|nr:low molecular weight protein arginine phosphatase [Elusimicrobiota bacterium]
MRVLFVCTGNSCRSVMAHYLLVKMAKARGMSWEVASCGLVAESTFGVPEGVHRALAPRGVSAKAHIPQPLTPELLQWCDIALAMTKMHRGFVVDQYPEHRKKVALFLEYTLGMKDTDVEDPIGQPDQAYIECRDLLERGLNALLERHAIKKS